MFKGNQQVHRLNAELLQLREDYLRVNRTLNALRVPQQENSNQLHMPDSALVSELETKTRDCEYYRSQL